MTTVSTLTFVCLFLARQHPPPHQCARAYPFARFLDHTQRRTAVGRTPLDERSARRRDLYLTTHNTHKRQTSMTSVGFEPTISGGERPQDRQLAGFGWYNLYKLLLWITIYIDIHRRLRDEVRRKRLKKWRTNIWFLLPHNAPAHGSDLLKDFLAKHVTTLEHPTFSSGLAPAHFYLLLRPKSVLKGHILYTASTQHQYSNRYVIRKVSTVCAYLSRILETATLCKCSDFFHQLRNHRRHLLKSVLCLCLFLCVKHV